MAPLIKDNLDLANSSADQKSSAREAAAPPQLRADAVSLEVHVKVHGSRVTEIGRGLPPRTEPFEEQTSTMIVFPRGGVLRLGAQVSSGQMLVLTNLKTRQDAICRVVKVRANGTATAYVEVEFTSAQPGYWGVTFPGESAPAAAPARPAAVPPAPAPAAVVKPVVSAAPPAAPPAPQKSSAPSSAFASIGVQEKIQPSAAPVAKPPSPVAAPRAAAPAALAIPPAAPANLSPEPRLDEAKLSAAISAVAKPETPAATHSLSLEELLGDAPSAAEAAVDSATSPNSSAAPSREESSSPAVERPIFGSFAASASSSAPAANVSAAQDSAPAFGARLDGSLSASSAPSRPSSRNGLFLAAGAAGILALLAGGSYFLRSHGARTASPASNSASSIPNPLPANSSDATALGVPASSFSPASSAPPSSNFSQQPVNPPALASRAPLSTAPSAAAPAPARQSQKPAVTSAMVLETINSHPVASQTSDQVSAAAPPVESDSSAQPGESALPGSIASPSGIAIAAPEIHPEGPVKVGGQVKAPRLVFSPPPVYPQIALEQNIQGDVVIQAVIDKTGRVTEAHVISGPLMLRQAALDSVRRWKYQPSVLNGEPVSVQMTVTLNFHHQ